MIEVHRRLAPMHAVRVARLLEPFDPFWYEEPVSARDLGALVECRREIRMPIVTGEELYTRFEFREVFERRAADIVNPDVCNVGGIQEICEIAAMAEAITWSSRRTTTTAPPSAWPPPSTSRPPSRIS